jgi:hypothetical protein
MPIVTVNEAIGDYTHIYKCDFTDLIAIGNGGYRTVLTLPAGAAVDLCSVIKTTQVAGSSSLVLDVGVSGTDGAFIAAWDADAATTGLMVSNTGTDFVQTAGNTVIEGGSLPVRAVSTATAIRLKVTDAAVASLTAGAFTIGFRVINLGRF